MCNLVYVICVIEYEVQLIQRYKELHKKLIVTLLNVRKVYDSHYECNACLLRHLHYVPFKCMSY